MLTPLSLRSHIDACSLLLFSTLLSLVYAVLAGGYCTCRSGTHSHRLEVTNVSSFFSYCRSVLPFHPRPILKARLQTPFMLIISVLIFIHLCAGNKVHAMDMFSSAQCAQTLGPSTFFRPSSLRPYLSSFLLPSSLSLLLSQPGVWRMQRPVCKLSSHARGLSQGPRCRSRCPSIYVCLYVSTCGPDASINGARVLKVPIPRYLTLTRTPTPAGLDVNCLDPRNMCDL